MAKQIKFENVTITGVQVTNVTMKNTGEVRVKQSITFTDASLQTYGAEAWGQDKVTELDLKQGEQVTLFCSLQGRMFGGLIIYSLQAYKAERDGVQQQNEGGDEPFKV